MQRCGHCRLQLYCGRDCQKKHWRKHKLVCKLMGAVKDADAESETTSIMTSTSMMTSTSDGYDSEEDEGGRHPCTCALCSSARGAKAEDVLTEGTLSTTNATMGDDASDESEGSSTGAGKAAGTSNDGSLSTTNATMGDDDKKNEHGAMPTSNTINAKNTSTNNSTHSQAHPNTPAHAHRCPICCPALQVRIRNPFIALQYGTWLHNRPKNDTYQLLLEAYRLRTGDKRNHQSRPTTPICCGAGFARFLQRAATRVPELLPSWWSDDHARACVEQTTRFFAQKASRRVPPTAQMVAAHFADASMPLQLRIFSCAVCGEHPTAYREGPEMTRETLHCFMMEMVRRERCAMGQCNCRWERLLGQAYLAEAAGILGLGRHEITEDATVVVVDDLTVSLEDVALGGEMGGDEDEQESDVHENDDDDERGWGAEHEGGYWGR